MEDKKDYDYGWCLFMNYKGLLERYYFKTEKNKKNAKLKSSLLMRKRGK